MKICMITLDSPSQGIRDGISSHVYYLSNKIGELGHHIWVIGLNSTISESQSIKTGNVTNISIPCKHQSLLLKMFTLYRKSQSLLKRLDSLHSFDLFHGHGGYVAPIISYKTKSPKILTLHNTFEYDHYLESDYIEKKDVPGFLKRKLFYPSFLLNYYRNWYYQSVDHIISVTQHNVNVTSSNFGLSEKKFTVIPNGFDMSEISQLPNSSPKNQILYFGRLEPHKGVQVLIKAYSLIHEKYPDTVLGIAGDGEYLPYLVKLVEQHGISDKVVFYGRLNRGPLFKEIQSSLFVVIPSFYEGIPIALFETASIGKPIIVSDLPGVREILSEESCLFFRSGDSDELASKLVWMLDNPVKAKTLELSANKEVKTKYNWNNIAINTLKVYEKTIHGVE